MDSDPDFEFDAPRWFDFAKAEDENISSSFNDSWFENVHPRHEPKARQQESTSGKPCPSKHKTKPGPIKKAHSKPGQINRGKDNKSLGIKTIRTKRGEHEPRTSREHTNKCCGVRETGGQSSDGRATADEFRSDPDFTFNPSWSISPSITGNNSNSVCQSSGGDKQNVVSQVEQNNSVEHVKSKPTVIRPAPSLVGSNRNQASLSSPVYHSSEGSLLSKAVIGAAKRRPPGGNKKRLLPTIPPQKKTPEVNTSSGRAELHKGQKIKPAYNVKNHSDSSSDPCDSNRVMHPCRSQTLAAPDEDGTGVFISVESKSRGLGQSRDPELQQSESMCNLNKPFTFEHGHRRIVESISPGINTQPSASAEQGEMSVEELLKLHNQRILATKCRYDENGRRIRSATPTFCPASDKVTKTAMKAKRKSTTVQTHPKSSANSVSAAQNKNLTPGSKEDVNLMSTSKQERGAHTTTIPSQYLLTQSNGNARPAVTTDKRARYSRGELQTVTKDNRTGYSRGELQAVSKDSGTGYSRGELQAVSKNSRAEGVVQTTQKQAWRSSMAKLSCPDKSSKHAITGQKRAGSITERTGASSKQKRCSCVASIGVNANAEVLQPSGGIHHNQKGVGKGVAKQKRRSCMAGTKTATSISDTDRELEELIHRHNSQLVAKK